MPAACFRQGTPSNIPARADDPACAPSSSRRKSSRDCITSIPSRRLVRGLAETVEEARVPEAVPASVTCVARWGRDGRRRLHIFACGPGAVRFRMGLMDRVLTAFWLIRAGSGCRVIRVMRGFRKSVFRTRAASSRRRYQLMPPPPAPSCQGASHVGACPPEARRSEARHVVVVTSAGALWKSPRSHAAPARAEAALLFTGHSTRRARCCTAGGNCIWYFGP